MQTEHGSVPEAALVKGNVVGRFMQLPGWRMIPLTAAVLSCSVGRFGRFPEVSRGSR